MDPGAAPLTRLVQDDDVGDDERSETLDIARFISGQALRSREAASRRMLQMVPEFPGAPFETRAAPAPQDEG
jgi:hypothetical protein